MTALSLSTYDIVLILQALSIAADETPSKIDAKEYDTLADKIREQIEIELQ